MNAAGGSPRSMARYTRPRLRYGNWNACRGIVALTDRDARREEFADTERLFERVRSGIRHGSCPTPCTARVSSACRCDRAAESVSIQASAASSREPTSHCRSLLTHLSRVHGFTPTYKSCYRTLSIMKHPFVQFNFFLFQFYDFIIRKVGF